MLGEHGLVPEATKVGQQRARLAYRPAPSAPPQPLDVARLSRGRGRILLTELSSGKLVLPCGSKPILSSTGVPWNDIMRLEEHRVPAVEIPEVRCEQHLIILSMRARDTVEWRIAGEKLPGAVTQARLGDVRIQIQDVPFSAHWQEATTLLILALDPSFVMDQAGSGDDAELTSPHHVRDPAIRYIMLALRAELQAGCPSGRLYGEALATALAVRLLHSHATVPARLAAERGALPSARLRRVINHIEMRLGGDNSLHQLATLARLSPRYFAALFKQSTGLSPHRYVLQRRIARAKELLAEDRQLSVAEIGYALGFASQGHFTTMFRKLAGVTPSAYRRRLRQTAISAA